MKSVASKIYSFVKHSKLESIVIWYTLMIINKWFYKMHPIKNGFPLSNELYLLDDVWTRIKNFQEVKYNKMAAIFFSKSITKLFFVGKIMMYDCYSVRLFVGTTDFCCHCCPIYIRLYISVYTLVQMKRVKILYLVFKMLLLVCVWNQKLCLIHFLFSYNSIWVICMLLSIYICVYF